MTRQTNIAIVLLCLLMMQAEGLATPYWTEAELEQTRLENNSDLLQRNLETGSRPPHQTLDEIAYFVKYRQLCDFLAGMQVTTPGQNFGGMREGEVGGDFGIIQTDNTQEAIRVWSQYAIWTGDTATYGQNIRDAWTYNARWPAWREEGGGYYAAHNCGWGFEAAAKYREAYGDTSKNWYADSCAWWTMANPLAISAVVDIAAQGLAIGGMYPHAIYRGRNDWRDFTLARARLIRNWFTASPARLNTATEWALCGGTALWGVCNSLWIAYPDSGAMWINQYGTQLETWESPSSWYNAYNTWYSNATFRCFEITGDSLFWNRGVFYCDSLIGFDVDNDGAIPPGTCCIGNGNDHSWVSAYMGWMGMERIISSGPIVIADINNVVTPDTSLLLMEGDTVALSISVFNQGTDTVYVILHADDQVGYSEWSTVQALAAGEAREISFESWALPFVDDLNDDLTLRVGLYYSATQTPFDSVEAHKTFEFDLRRRTNVFGVISGEFDPNGAPIHIDFYAEDYPDSIWTSVDIAAGQQYNNGVRQLPEGQHRMVITPPLRYLTDERVFFTVSGNTDPFDINLTSTDVLLVDDDGGEEYESYLLTSLEQNQEDVRVWDRQSAALSDLNHVPWLIWMTGDENQNTLTPEDQQTLTAYLASGHGVLVTGQNISDDDATESFLRDVFYCTPDRDDTDKLRAYGLGDDPDVDGQFLLLLGSQGAGNQNSPSSLSLLNNATAIFINDTLTEEICGISGYYESGRFIFLSFGLEAASGQAGSTSRAQFLSEAKEWLTETSDVAPGFVPQISQFELLPSYPNPFNSEVRISWIAPNGSARTNVTVYDLLGRQVATLFDGNSLPGGNNVTWNGATSSGISVASGTYVVRLQTQTITLSQPLRYIR